MLSACLGVRALGRLGVRGLGTRRKACNSPREIVDPRHRSGYILQPFLYSRRMNLLAAGALATFICLQSHSIFVPACRATLPSRTISVNGPAWPPAGRAGVSASFRRRVWSTSWKRHRSSINWSGS